MKKILISIHDVSSFYKKELKIIFNQLNKLGIDKKEAFVVINWLEKYSLEKDKGLVNELKKNFLIDQLKFHGLVHYYFNPNSGKWSLFGKRDPYVKEFKGKNSFQVEKNFERGLASFKKIFKNKPDAFIPPHWANSDILLETCRKFGIKYSEDFDHLINLEKKEKRFSLVTCLDKGDSKILNRLSRVHAKIVIFLSWAFGLPLRFSMHPNDVRNGNIDFEMKLLKKLLNKGWKPMTTREFWRDKC
jgi:predicted deacetylase